MRAAASRAPLALSLALWSMATSAACSHDLDALKAERDQAGLRGGSGGSRGGSSGKGGSSAGTGSSSNADGGTAGSGPDAVADGGGPGPATCEPCPALTTAAMNLNLRNCCRGTASDECGLTFGEGSVCLPRMVPEQDAAVCPELTMGPLTLAGCCRPDSRCGVAADQVGLGCVARDEILPALGLASPAPIACAFTCMVDADCGGSDSGRVCAESLDHNDRVCEKACKRDRDCPRGKICGLSNDIARDRVLAICRDPVGDVQPGSFCSAANDCVHGVCSRLPGMDPFCTQLCVNGPDCPATAARCGDSMIPTPSMQNTNDFKICLP